MIFSYSEKYVQYFTVLSEMPKKKRNQITLYPDDLTLQKFIKLCAETNRSLSNQAATIIYQAVKDVKL